MIKEDSFYKKNVRKLKGKKCQQRNKIPSGTRKGQRQQAENQISDVDNVLATVSRAEKKRTQRLLK